MELSKIRPGQNYNYVTIHGNEGRGKVIGIVDGQRGSFVQIADKETGKQIKVRPSQLSR
jgi:hypothetical protein